PGSRLIDHGVRSVSSCLIVVTLRPIKVALEFRHVAQIVQREGIVGVDQVRLVEKVLGLVDVMLLKSVYAVAIKLLYWRVFALLGQRNANLLGRCAGSQTQDQSNQYGPKRGTHG